MKDLTVRQDAQPAQPLPIQRKDQFTQKPDEVPLAFYWNVLKKRRNTILIIFLAVFATGAYFALSATPIYTATATIKIEPRNPQVTGLGELQGLDTRVEYDYYQTQFSLLGSRPLAGKVIAELALESNGTFTNASIISPNPLDHIKSWMFRALGYLSYSLKFVFKSKTVEPETDVPFGSIGANIGNYIELRIAPGILERYLGFLDIAPIKRTQLVAVKFTTPDAALSQVVANAHVETFLSMTLESRFSLTKEAQGFLDQKKLELRQKLEKSESALSQFRRAHGVVSVEKGENIVIDRLVDINKQLTSARAQRLEAESLFRTVENKNHRDLAEITKQGLVHQLKSNIANLEAEKARLSTVFKPTHPRIQELSQQIALAQQAFDGEVTKVVQSIRSSYMAALAKERALQNEAEKQQSDALKLRELGVDYTLLQEEVNANKALYETLLRRLSETNITRDLAVSNMQIVERAARPTRPSGPNVSLYLIASLASGLFLGVGWALLREFASSNVGTPDDVWRAVGIATLGVVPDLKYVERPSKKFKFLPAATKQIQSSKNRRVGNDLIISYGPFSLITESYRSIRTSLLLSQAEKPPQVILLTSPSPGEGKTVTSLNLAIALAQDGHSVLLVDGDMRKGACSERLGLRNHRGLSNVLTGGLSLRESIQQTPVVGLSLLSRGVTPPNPSELLGSRKMIDVVNELRQQFDYILMDSPPVIGISDAAILSVVADGVLLIFHGENTSTAYAQKAVERLDTVHARLLGVVLNAVNLDDPHYKYYQSYSTYYDIPDRQESTANERQVESVVSKTRPAMHQKEINELRQSPEQQNSTIIRKSEEFCSGDEKREQVVSRELMERLVEIFAESIGPVAPLVVRDQVAILGESQNAFPKNRLEELIKLMTPEILHDELRVSFQNKISEEIGHWNAA